MMLAMVQVDIMAASSKSKGQDGPNGLVGQSTNERILLTKTF